jgi:enoyl-CoA hydratase/carnithine racemase
VSRPTPRTPDELGFESILYAKAPPRATITFNRPEVLNAFDWTMLRELARACEDAAYDDEIRVVVLTGAGRAFCVGANLRSWADDGLVGDEREYWKWFRAMEEGVTAIRRIGKPTVARINGICVGGGNEMQMACDLAVMVEDAFIRHVGLQHGSVPSAGATQWLPLIVGDRRAREIILLCEEIPAAQALEWGLVNRVVPAAALDATVDELVAKLADRIPLMTRYAKAQLDFFRDLAWHGTIRHAHDWLALSMLSDQSAEGVRAFLERRGQGE